MGKRKTPRESRRGPSGLSQRRAGSVNGKQTEAGSETQNGTGADFKNAPVRFSHAPFVAPDFVPLRADLEHEPDAVGEAEHRESGEDVDHRARNSSAVKRRM